MWTTFECEAPDFQVRSVPDNVTFGVKRAAMQRSEVFRDMFSMCEPNLESPDASMPSVPDNDPTKLVGLDESADSLAILLKLLHDPPKPPIELPSDSYEPFPKKYDPTTVIPLPLLELVILKLIDKYILDEAIVKALEGHLLAHAPTDGLRVYGIALAHDRSEVATIATQYILPVAQYSKEEIRRSIPSVELYHDIVRFQDFRVKALRDLVLKEDIFPHGYGECTVHRDATLAAWDSRRRGLLARIESGSDVAWEMRTKLEETLRHCRICHKACMAAVDMLAYKCRRIPWALHKLPQGFLDS